MIGLLQRVSRASVEVGGRQVASIGRGLLVLVGVQPADTEAEADQLLARLLDYRVFPDANDRMNLSLRDIDGGLLLVPQFTLAADTSRGRRPSFTSAAPPALGARLFDYLVVRARGQRTDVGSGVFGADMQVALVNDGPATFWLEIPPALS
jgi:D-tyrosyl-tRNA(Tyr) deacylase